MLIIYALIHSDAAREGALKDHHAIAVSTYGIVFMGTPHQGGNGVAVGKALVTMASLFVKADDKILKVLERDSQLLHTQLGQFATISSQFATKFAFETFPTPTVFGNTLIVRELATALLFRVLAHLGRLWRYLLQSFRASLMQNLWRSWRIIEKWAGFSQEVTMVMPRYLDISP